MKKSHIIKRLKEHIRFMEKYLLTYDVNMEESKNVLQMIHESKILLSKYL
jgi:hypothetical protein